MRRIIQFGIALHIFIIFPLFSKPIAHTLKAGETLYSLSRRYAVTVDQIVSFNNISSPSSLSVGTEILIPKDLDAPVSNEKNQYYRVLKGDTLYGIARKNNIDIDQLKKLNKDIQFDSLKIGQKLKIGEIKVSPAQAQPASSSSSIVKATRVNYSSASGLVWPVEGIRKKFSGKMEGHVIAGKEASYINSVSEGTVMYVGPFREFKQVILVNCRDFLYLYGGSDDVFVNKGQKVYIGTRLGRLGYSSLQSKTVSMYFSVFKDGIPINYSAAPKR